MPMSEEHRLGPKGNNPPTAEQLLKERHATLFDRKSKWDKDYKKLKGLAPETLEDCAKLEKLYADGRDLVNDADGERTKEKEPHLEAGRVVDGFFNTNFRDAIGVDRKKGGPAADLLQRAADKRLEITEASQKAEREKAEALAAEAAKAAAKAETLDAKGQHRQADVSLARAEALDNAASAAGIAATQDVSQASKTSIGGVTSSVKAKHEATQFDRATVDLESIRMFLPADAVLKAINAYLKQTGDTSYKGATVTRQAVGSVRK